MPAAGFRKHIAADIVCEGVVVGSAHVNSVQQVSGNAGLVIENPVESCVAWIFQP
jgi:hypothetical protein